MIYTCAICGKTYNKITDRAQCEMDCAAAEELRKKKEEEKKIKTERITLEKKIETKLNELEPLLNDYYKSYNKIPDLSYTMNGDNVKFSVGDEGVTNEKKDWLQDDDTFAKIINSLFC